MGLISKIKRFFKEVYNELKRVSFPGKKELWLHTIITLVMIVLVALIIGLFDILLSLIIKRVL